MDIKNILPLVLRNNPDLVIRALEIENGMWDMSLQPKFINKRLGKEHFPDGHEMLHKFVEGKTSIEFDIEIIAVDPFNMSQPYCVKLPNGSVRWTGKDRSYM